MCREVCVGDGCGEWIFSFDLFMWIVKGRGQGTLVCQEDGYIYKSGEEIVIGMLGWI